MTRLSSIADLERVVGSRPASIMLKSIDVLDSNCVGILALSPFAVLGYADGTGAARAVAVGGAPGFIEVRSERLLRVPLHAPLTPDPKLGCSLLFFVPGLGETLRINGRARPDGEALLFDVEEAFVHCAKSLIRSAFWKPAAPPPPAPGEVGHASSGPLAAPELQDFLPKVSFVVLTSWAPNGDADASPKGDPPGFLRLRGDRQLSVPDRPGNRRMDTFRNLLGQPKVGMLALAPGDPRSLELSGLAFLTTDPALLDSMTVAGKTPRLALTLEVERAELREDPALAAAALWDPTRLVPKDLLPNMSRVFVEHVKQNKDRGFAAAAMRAMASEWMMEKGLAYDYEKNLY